MSDCILHLSISHSPVFLLNSCLDLVSAPLPEERTPYSEVTGVNLPSSLTVNLPSASVFSTRLRVSVCGTGTSYVKLRGFSRESDYLHYHSFDFAQPCVFVKQLPGPILCASPGGEDPLFRSYGVNLPSSLTVNLPSASVFSTRLRVSVCGTGTSYVKLSGFSRESDYLHYHSARRLRVLSASTLSASTLWVDLPAQIYVYNL